MSNKHHKHNKKENESNPFFKAFSSQNNQDEEVKDKGIDDTEVDSVEENVLDQESNEEDNQITVQDCAKINQLGKKYDELHNQYIRLAADFDNYRKRQAGERENLLNFGLEKTLGKMVEVLDNFERAQQSMEKMEDIDKVKESFSLIHNQFLDSLKKLGLEEIETQDKVFDPNLHEALMQTPSEEYDEEEIINELQKGYKLGDKVLRPARVNVAVRPQ